MKHILFATAALAATLYIVSPSWAADAPSGYVDASYTNGNTEILGTDLDSDTYALNGAVVLPSSTNWAVKLDAAVANTDDGFDDTTSVSGTVHAFHKGDGWLAGGFAGATKIDDDTAWAVGVEGQKELTNVTLAGTLAYGTVDDVDVDLWSARGEARYFINDNFRLSGGLGFAKADFAGGDTDMWSAGVGGEYKFASNPISLFAAYDHTEWNDIDLTSDAVTVGVRYTFGGQSLRERDRSGADLNSVDRVFSGLF
jgi:hypothetical protein